MKCPNCEKNTKTTDYCEHCGVKIESATQLVAAEEQRKNILKGKNVTGIALFSALVPGMGQVCNGQYKKGLLVLFGTIIGVLLFLIPGLIVWLYGIYDAYSTAKKMDNGEIEFREPGSLVFIGFLVLWVIIVLGTVVLLLFGIQYFVISHHSVALPAVTAAATPAALPSAAVTAGPASAAGAPDSQTLIILSATYGAAGKNKDVTEWLKTKIVNNAINTPVTNENIGSDPAYGLTKYLTVKYQYNGEERTAKIIERGTLIIP